MITRWQQHDQSAVVTCSALKKVYRQVLVHGASQQETSVINKGALQTEHIDQNTSKNENALKDQENSTNEDISGIHHISADVELNPEQIDEMRVVVFVYLKGSKDFILKRLEQRKGHFMPVSLLESQLKALEEPGDDERHVTISIESTVQQTVHDIIAKLNLPS